MSVLPPAVEEWATVSGILGRGVDLALLTVARDTIAFEVAQVCIDRLGADKRPPARRASLRVQLHDPRLHGHPPGARPGSVRTAGPRVPALQLGCQFRASAARIEPTVRRPPPGRPVWIAACTANGLVHFSKETARYSTHTSGSRALVSDLARADADVVLFTGHEPTIGNRGGGRSSLHSRLSHPRRQRLALAWRSENAPCCVPSQTTEVTE